MRKGAIMQKKKKKKKKNGMYWFKSLKEKSQQKRLSRQANLRGI